MPWYRILTQYELTANCSTGNRRVPLIRGDSTNQPVPAWCFTLA